MLPILIVLGFLGFLNGIEGAPLAKNDTVTYRLVPNKLRKFLTPELFNEYNKLSAEQQNQISAIGLEIKETGDKNQYLHNIIKVSNRFAVSVLRAYYSEIPIVQDTISEPEHARMSNQAEKAYQLFIALTSRDQEYIDRATDEAKNAA